MRKAVFFDIDGTLWDNHMQIPESTITAIHRLRANGHLAFLSSGRSRSAIRSQELLGIGFDGILAGCGTYVEYENEILLNECLSYDKVMELYNAMVGMGAPAILEGTQKLFADMIEFRDDPYVKYLKSILGDDLHPMQDYCAADQINKMSCDVHRVDHDVIRAKFAEEYNLIFHNQKVVEIVPRGFNKATGIAWICEKLGIAQEDTVAFGDSPNDLDMLEYCGVGVCMGNGAAAAKAAADYITADIHEDGIFKGLEYLNLI